MKYVIILIIVRNTVYFKNRRDFVTVLVPSQDFLYLKKIFVSRMLYICVISVILCCLCKINQFHMDGFSKVKSASL